MKDLPSPSDSETLSPALAALWMNVCAELTGRIGEAEFERWFSPVRLVRLEPDALWFSAPNAIYSLWIEENYLSELTASICAHLPTHPPVRFEIAAAPTMPLPAPADVAEPAPKVEQEPDAAAFRHEKLDPESIPDTEPAPVSGRTPADRKRIRQRGEDAGLSEGYRFDNFVVGNANRIAAAAAKAVAEKPGKTYHPLFIYSNSGLGKTHLLHAIGWDSLTRRPKSKVIYITAERFANDYVEALQENRLVAFRKRFREADMLLIDDIAFLSGKSGMQEEFFHTFNSLTDRHKQIVLTSDRPASEIADLEERLVSRFKWGMTAEIVMPGAETRLAILRRKREERGANLPDSVLEFIAEHVSTNVRALEGAMLRAATMSSLHEGELAVDPDELRDLLADYLDDANTSRHISVQEIIELVATHFDLHPRDLTGKRRTSRLVEARHVAMALAREKTSLSLADIGKEFGGRDHGTVINACRRVTSKIESNASTRRTFDFLRRSLLAPAPARPRGGQKAAK